MSPQSSSPAAMSGGGDTRSSPRRVIKPARRFRPSSAAQIEERSRLLSKIGAFCREACVRLGVKETPVTLACFLDSGVCLGLLDPVSNVMANTLFTSDFRRGPRRKVVDEAKLGELADRSIDGLVAFLIYFFPYLAGWDAQRYLLVADADLLVAARLIVADRGMMSFSVTSAASVPAFEGALRLAAKVAKHPEPQRLVKVWMSLSTQPHQAFGFLSAMQTKADTQGINLVRLQRLLHRRPFPDLGKAWDLAASRPPYSNAIANMPYQATRSLRMALLNTIRSFYLRALARLPRHELRTRYHRSLLMGGYCYGPLDPVSNIIVNTIWYDVMSPAAEQPVLDMIGPMSLVRLETRSFYGLASYLQSRYHNLSEHQVVQCLVASCGHLSLADPNLDDGAPWDDDRPFASPNLNAPAAAAEAEWQQQQCTARTPGLYDAMRKLGEQTPCTSAEEAFEAAATAAWHPKPEAHAIFLDSWKETLKGPAFWMLHNGDQLTSENVQYIASLFSPRWKGTPERIIRLYDSVGYEKMRAEAKQTRITRKVKAALDKHLLQDGEPMFELHIICSANENVCGPEYCDDEMDALSIAPCKYRYSHVNFWVTEKDSSSAVKDPILFFAEFDNEEEEGEPLLFCRVDVPTPFAEHFRCLYCEVEGVKIVHPPSGELHGGGQEFEEVICGEYYLTNDEIICHNEGAVQRMCGVEEDFLYVSLK